MKGKTAGIIIIGDEILKGHVKDTNSHFMCKRLYALGTKVMKISVIEDSISEIAKTVREFSENFDLVVTSGGIGPTHDDVTYSGVAEAFGESVLKNTSLEDYWRQYDSEESSYKMSLVPPSSNIIWTDLYSSIVNLELFPVVHTHNVFVFPGVPQYLEPSFISLEKKYFQSPGFSFYTGRIYLSVGEDLVLEALNKTVAELQDCIFGSYPVVANPKYKTQITVEARSIEKVKEAEAFFRSSVSPEWLVPWCSDMTNSVYKFSHSTADPALSASLDKSIKIVEETFERYPASDLMVSFNGGKDCTALLHIVMAVTEMRSSTTPLQAVYFRPSNPFPEVEQFINDTVSRYKIELTTLPGPIKSALDVLVSKKPNIKGIFLGTRRTDPFSQDLQHFQMTDPGWAQVMRISPLLHWGYRDIWTLLRGISAPYCSLYDRGYTSLGNQDNTSINPSLQYTEADGTLHYQPAWMLADETKERNGRM